MEAVFDSCLVLGDSFLSVLVVRFSHLTESQVLQGVLMAAEDHAVRLELGGSEVHVCQHLSGRAFKKPPTSANKKIITCKYTSRYVFSDLIIAWKNVLNQFKRLR